MLLIIIWLLLFDVIAFCLLIMIFWFVIPPLIAPVSCPIYLLSNNRNSKWLLIQWAKWSMGLFLMYTTVQFDSLPSSLRCRGTEQCILCLKVIVSIVYLVWLFPDRISYLLFHSGQCQMIFLCQEKRFCRDKVKHFYNDLWHFHHYYINRKPNNVKDSWHVLRCHELKLQYSKCSSLSYSLKLIKITS